MMDDPGKERNLAFWRLGIAPFAGETAHFAFVTGESTHCLLEQRKVVFLFAEISDC